MANRIRVLVADDDPLVRDWAAAVLAQDPAVQVVGGARDAAETVKKASLLRPDVVFVDLAMPLGGGPTVVRHVRAAAPVPVVCVLTASVQPVDLFAALRAGARGYLAKPLADQELQAAVHTLAAGGSVVSPHLPAHLLTEVATLLGRQAQRRTALAMIQQLTRRERAVLELLTQGATNVEIATALTITRSTTKVHVRHILHKLRLRNRQQLAAYAAGHRLAVGPVRAALSEHRHSVDAMAAASRTAAQQPRALAAPPTRR